MIKNQVIDLRIESYGAFGEGVAHVDGFAVFVPYALVGELVETLILSVKKGYAYGKVLSIKERSEKRQIPKCEYFTRCGGCDIQHLLYSEQLELKRNSVKETLRRVGGVDVDVDAVYPSPNEYDCRNKLTLPFALIDGKAVLGFYSERTHRVVGIKKCLLSAWSEDLIKITTDWANRYKLSVYDEKTNKGLLRALTARVADGKIMITLVVTKESVPHLGELCDEYKKQYPDGIMYLNINQKETNVVLGDKCIHVFGDKKLMASALGVSYELSPLSFGQVNDKVRDGMYAAVVSEISENDIVVDAYSGAGLMSVLCAKKAKQVYGVEIIPDAVKDADDTARKNGVSSKVKNVVGDCSKVLPKLFDEIRRDEPTAKMTVILDPPRKGCDQTVLDSVLVCAPDKIVYVSCNPATLARDLKTLTQKYSINYVKLFDLFPQTKHVESLVCLSRQTN